MDRASRRAVAAAVIGNLLEHFDSALFALMAPFLAPVVFEPLDPTTRLVLTYAMLPLGFFSHPLGALVFGRIGDSRGRSHALSLSITGMALTTGAMGLLPSYHEVGWLSPCFLALTRTLQSFFGAGETMGGGVLALEHTPKKRHGLVSGLYASSTVAGYLLASAFSALLCYLGYASTHWRYLFVAASLTCLAGLYLRLNTPCRSSPKKPAPPLMPLIHRERRTLLLIAMAAGCSYAHYASALVLMNTYAPIVAHTTLSASLTLNTLLLHVDMALLPLFGWIADRTSPQRVMGAAALATCLLPLPLFLWLQESEFLTILFVRLLLVIIGAGFAAPFHSWAQGLVPASQRYTLISLAYAVGSRLLGAPCAAISLWLFQTTHWVAAPALYLSLCGLITTLVLLGWTPRPSPSARAEEQVDRRPRLLP